MWVKGFGERVPYKTPTYAEELLQTPMIKAAESAFTMADLGPADMDMVSIARGFGVDGEIVRSPAELREALTRARAHTVEGKPYLLDVQVARKGVGWAEEPWVPPIQVAALRTKKV